MTSEERGRGSARPGHCRGVPFGRERNDVYLDRLSFQIERGTERLRGKRYGSEVPLGTGADENEGVAEVVRQTANSIGYMELVYALRHRLSFGAVRNAAGQFVLRLRAAAPGNCRPPVAIAK